MKSYEQKLANVTKLWGEETEKQAQSVPPDWRCHLCLRKYAIMRTANIEKFLDHIEPGMTALKFGGGGWLSLAMGQRGAHVAGLDISDKALQVARAYCESVRHEVSGTVAYQTADLNTLELTPEHYDVIAVNSTVHSLVNLKHVVDQMHQVLKPGALLSIYDSHGEEAMATILVASAFMFVLPTRVRYGQRVRGLLLRFRTGAPARIKASIEAQGLLPFAGAGREHDWLELVQQEFAAEKHRRSPAFTDYTTAQVNAPDWLVLPLLRLLHAVDRVLVHLRLLKSTGVLLYARR